MRMKYLNRTSPNENVCPTPRTGCGYLGRVTAILGVLTFLIMNNGPLDAADSKPAAGETAGKSAVTVNSDTTAAAIFSKNQPEQTVQQHGDAVKQQANSITRTEESGYASFLAFGDMQGGTGRCNSSHVCHYSMALMEAAHRETQAAGSSEAEAAVSFDPTCAAKDLDATTRIEELGINEEVSDKLATAGLKLMAARVNCAHGRIAEALKQYENLLGHTLDSAEAR